MRHWKLKPTGSDWPTPGTLNEEESDKLVAIIQRMRFSEVAAFDAADAADAMLLALGLELAPCCALDEDPCARCSEAAQDRAQEAREEGFGPSGVAAGMWPEEARRASDADRGTVPDR